MQDTQFDTEVPVHHCLIQFQGRLRKLAPSSMDGRVKVTFQGQQTIKHIVESLGVPHTEIGQVICKEREAQIADVPENGDLLEVFPVQIPAPMPAGEPRFILDVHMGKLAHYLRMLGFDTWYQTDANDEELAARANEEKRILISRDRGLLKRKQVEYGFLLTEDNPRIQLQEVVERYDLRPSIRPFQRCMICNGLLRPVDKNRILNDLQPNTKSAFSEFHHCVQCGRIYWKGTHYDHMMEIIRQIQKK